MALPRLNAATADLVTPPALAYDRDAMSTTIVHLGLGAFARAFLCVIADDLMTLGHDHLRVLGVSLRNDEVARALNPQDGLYVETTIDGAHRHHRIIGSLDRVVHAPTAPHEVRHALAASTTALVTITVTEKGYCTDPATGRLDHSHPDIVHDLAHPQEPRSLAGHLVLAAADRRDTGAGNMTVLSLDNLPSNGQVVAASVRELAAAQDDTLVDWIDEHVAFPSSMVDRMVPATTDDVRTAVRQANGFDDAWPVQGERFRQWVVENTWATPMPALAEAGVQIADDVAPWEMLKLRVLNGLHTAVALYGITHGLETVDQVASDRDGRALLEELATEIDEVLVPPQGVRTRDYIESTLERFGNAGLAHRCAQIATDTSQKLPQRLLATLRQRREQGLESDAITAVLGLWAWSTTGRDHLGQPCDVRDPLAATYAEIANRCGDEPDALARELVGIESIFGDLAGDESLTAGVAKHLAMLI